MNIPKSFGQATNPELLDQELQELLEEDEHSVFLRHPLVFAVPYIKERNSLYNQQLKAKREALEKAKENKEWHSYVFLHERPYRLDAFLMVKHLIEDGKEWWGLLGDIWIDSENIWSCLEEWKDLLTSDRPYKEYFMSEEERKYFNELPDKITIYRGCNNLNEEGLSWTLDREEAEWFSRRIENGFVLEKEITRDKAFAYLSGRGESEIIYIEHIGI